MPQTTTFSYLDAFRFDGHVIKNATLAPFSTARIDADVTIYASYEGKIQPLPPTDETVIGLLDTQTDNERFKLQTWICPRYHEISSRQLDDLLLCYQDGACS